MIPSSCDQNGSKSPPKITENGAIYQGHVLNILRSMPEESVQCVVTSPPYWGLRDYKTEGQIGLEKTPEEYVTVMVEVFREVRRVLRKDGTLWLNLGDSYAGSWGDSGHRPGRDGVPGHQREKNTETFNREGHPQVNKPVTVSPPGLKPKDLCGVPWRVAFALQADGWWLRSDIIWSKPNPMPESVTDRPTKAHEYIFLLTKSQKYYWDQEAVREESINQDATFERYKYGKFQKVKGSLSPELNADYRNMKSGRNIRSVWNIATQPFPEAHFATFPEAIPERCIKAGSKVGDTILDPFFGAGTVGLVAEKLNRKWIGIELNPEYCEMAEKRILGKCWNVEEKQENWLQQTFLEAHNGQSEGMI